MSAPARVVAAIQRSAARDLGSICALCDLQEHCNRPQLFTTECFRFSAAPCERCKEEHPERACRPPACLGEEVRP